MSFGASLFVVVSLVLVSSHSLPTGFQALRLFFDASEKVEENRFGFVFGEKARREQPLLVVKVFWTNKASQPRKKCRVDADAAIKKRRVFVDDDFVDKLPRELQR